MHPLSKDIKIPLRPRAELNILECPTSKALLVSMHTLNVGIKLK